MCYANFGRGYDRALQRDHEFNEKLGSLMRGWNVGRKLQIGVMGLNANTWSIQRAQKAPWGVTSQRFFDQAASDAARNEGDVTEPPADLQYGADLERLAEEVGKYMAKANAALMFGAEKDYDSLSTAACRGAKSAGGMTVGVTYGKGLDDVYELNNADIIIASGMERGGGMEFALVLSCDAIICISGGSGTLIEIAIAYQANIPIVVLQGTGGWSEKLENEYLDARRRVQVETAQTAQEAVLKAITSASTKWLVGGLEH